MIKFYGSPNSSAARTHIMLEEVGAPYEYISFKPGDGGTRTPEFRKINPSGKIPAIVDGDLALFESMAINLYLAEKFKPAMFPSDYGPRALTLQWSFWAISNVQPEAFTAFLHGSRLPEEQRNPQMLTAAKDKLRVYYDALESQLTGEYLLGNRYTVADVNAGTVLNFATRVVPLEPSHPRIAAWLDRLRARPAWQKVAASG